MLGDGDADAVDIQAHIQETRRLYPKMTKKGKSQGIKIEETLRKAEILLDSATQKLLRSLAYYRHLRHLIKEDSGSWQWTLTHKPQSKAMQSTDFGNKRWTMGVPKEKEKPLEYGLWAECWFCNRVFQKKLFCKDCGFAVCYHCGKCGCKLAECCKEAVRKTIRAIYGLVSLPPHAK